MKEFWGSRYLTIGVIVLLVLALAGVSVALGLERSRGDSGAVAAGSDTTVSGQAGSEGTNPSNTVPLVVEPKTEAVELPQIQTPPQHTLAYISADEYSADADYMITFVPYGSGMRPRTLIIQISASRPRSGVTKPYDFVGRNVMVDTSLLPPDMAVEEGGTYTGILRLVKQESGLSAGGVLAPMLIEASPSE